jgi:hypothetical protein
MRTVFAARGRRYFVLGKTWLGGVLRPRLGRVCEGFSSGELGEGVILGSWVRLFQTSSGPSIHCLFDRQAFASHPPSSPGCTGTRSIRTLGRDRRGCYDMGWVVWS